MRVSKLITSDIVMTSSPPRTKLAQEANINKIEKHLLALHQNVCRRTSGYPCGGRKVEEANHHIKPETNTLEGEQCSPFFFILARQKRERKTKFDNL
jgi:hypothetical protein